MVDRAKFRFSEETLVSYPIVSENPWLSEWDAAAASGDGAAIEEIWLRRLEQDVGDGTELTEALRRLRGAGKKTLAATLLEIAADQAGSDGAWLARKLFLCEQLRLGLGDAAAHKRGLEECVREIWHDRPSLEKLLAHFGLASGRKAAETLEEIESWLAHDVGGVFSMTGRGAGRVIEANPQLGVLRLDFEKEKKVPVPIGAASRYLTPLPVGHFLRRKLEERAALKAEVKERPAEAVEHVLSSFGTPMTVSELKAALDGLVAEAEWTAWWNRARKNPRLVASGTGARVVYRLASEGGATAEIRAEFENTTPAGKVELARRHGGRNRELGELMGAELLDLATIAETEAGMAWEALAIAERLGASEVAVASGRRALVDRYGALELLSAVGDATLREGALGFVLGHLAGGATTELLATWLERETHPRLFALTVAELRSRGGEALATSFLDQVFLAPLRFPAGFLWLCEAAPGEGLELVEDKLGGAFLVRLVELAERKEMTPFRARLREVLSARGLAGRIVQDRLTVEQGRRLMQILESPGELADERNWLRRALLLRFPELRPNAPVEAVPVLAATVLRLQEELRHLLEKEIPATLKAIQIAKEHGDLRENFEYHAARARQEFLSARASTLQEDLGRIKVIDPTTLDLSVVRVGAEVDLLGGDGTRRTITILGPYEANAERSVLSNGSEAAHALLGRDVGATVTFDGGTWSIAAIKPAKVV
jgi:transcription elongation GreA/GreB family factor